MARMLRLEALRCATLKVSNETLDALSVAGADREDYEPGVDSEPDNDTEPNAGGSMTDEREPEDCI